MRWPMIHWGVIVIGVYEKERESDKVSAMNYFWCLVPRDRQKDLKKKQRRLEEEHREKGEEGGWR